MTVTKKQLKQEIGATSVAEVTTILQVANRPFSAQEIADEDAEFVRQAYKLIKQGMTVVQAVQHISGKKNLKNDKATEGVHNQVNEQVSAGVSSKDEVLSNMLIDDVRKKAIQYNAAFFTLLPAAINSAEVLESDAVQNAIAYTNGAIGAAETGEFNLGDNDFLMTAVRTASSKNLLPPTPRNVRLLSDSTQG